MEEVTLFLKDTYYMREGLFHNLKDRRARDACLGGVCFSGVTFFPLLIDFISAMNRFFNTNLDPVLLFKIKAF